MQKIRHTDGTHRLIPLVAQAVTWITLIVAGAVIFMPSVSVLGLHAEYLRAFILVVTAALSAAFLIVSQMFGARYDTRVPVPFLLIIIFSVYAFYGLASSEGISVYGSYVKSVFPAAMIALTALATFPIIVRMHGISIIRFYSFVIVGTVLCAIGNVLGLIAVETKDIMYVSLALFSAHMFSVEHIPRNIGYVAAQGAFFLATLYLFIKNGDTLTSLVAFGIAFAAVIRLVPSLYQKLPRNPASVQTARECVSKRYALGAAFVLGVSAVLVFYRSSDTLAAALQKTTFNTLITSGAYSSAFVSIVVLLLFLYMGFRILFSPEFYEKGWYTVAKAAFASGVVILFFSTITRVYIPAVTLVYMSIGILACAYIELMPARVISFGKTEKKKRQIMSFGIGALGIATIVPCMQGVLSQARSAIVYEKAIQKSENTSRAEELVRAYGYYKDKEYASLATHYYAESFKNIIQNGGAKELLNTGVSEAIPIVRAFHDRYPDDASISSSIKEIYGVLVLLGVKGADYEYVALCDRYGKEDCVSNNAEAYAVALLALGKTQEVKLLIETTKDSMSPSMWHEIRARLFVKEREYSNAIVELAEVIRQNPYNREVRILYGVLVGQVSGVPAAAVVFDEYIRDFPDEEDGYIFSALAHVAYRDMEGARTLLAVAVEKSAVHDRASALLQEISSSGTITSIMPWSGAPQGAVDISNMATTSPGVATTTSNILPVKNNVAENSTTSATTSSKKLR